MRAPLAVVGLLLVVPLSPLESQSCLGRPRYALGAVQIGAAVRTGDPVGMLTSQLGESAVAEVVDRQTLIGGGIGIGGARGTFLQVEGFHARYDVDDDEDFDDTPTGWVVDALIGFDVRPAGAPRLSFCPVLSANYGDASASATIQGVGATDVTLTQLEFGGGLHLGYELGAAQGTGVTFVPFGGVRIMNVRSELEADGVGNLADADQLYFPTTLGLAFIVNGRWGIDGRAIVPFGHDEAGPRYGVGLTIGFGGGR